MNLFHIVEDAQVILRSKGTFYQKKVFRRGDRLYADWGSGFIRLGGGDATSCPNVSYETLNLPAAMSITFGPTREPMVSQVPTLKVAA